MQPLLLERRDALDALTRLAAQAHTAAGRVAFVAGEAGIGKTSLLRAFGHGTPLLWGACDPLATPRPLLPLHDIAPALGAAVTAALARDGGRLEVLAAVLGALGERPRTLVLDDVHWADDATLDLLAYLGRRIERTRTLLVASYRDDEVGPAHALRRVLGTLPGAARIALPALSAAAVHELVGARAIDSAEVHRRTGGNPFYVTEVLGAGGLGVPPTVRDAVLARAAQLPAEGRAALGAAAAIGPRIEPWLLAALLDGDAEAAVDACVGAGVLRGAGESLEFRHELARQAVLESLTPARRHALHRRALQALRARPGIDLARLAHHADAADDRDALLDIAPRAARQAAAVGAHRQAHAQYARALRHADALPPVERAALLEAYALECQIVGELLAGIAARERVIALRRELGDVRAEGDAQCRLATMLCNVGRNDDAEAAARRGLVLLAPLPPGPELAFAYRTQAFLHMVARDNDEAIAWGHKAVALCERHGLTEGVASALNSIGSATIHLDYEAGCALLERSREAARAAGSDTMIMNADSNLGSASGEVHRFERAEAYLANGIAFAAEREMDPSYQQAWRALCLLHLGRWDDAGDLALEVLATCRERAISLNMAQLALGRLRARRGDAGAWSALDQALALADASGHLQRVAPVRAARAEAAWLAGDRERCIAEARAAWPAALARRHAWFVGELAWWLHLAGAPVDVPDACAATPYALQLAADWRGAADAWAARNCPYEQARALAGGDTGAQREALAIHDRLGARPAADALRQALRARGDRGVPRGPRAATRSNRFGLTAREQDVLALLVDGLTNAQIGARRHLSTRTVDHHVASILGKLGVGSRDAAARTAREHGLLAQAGQRRPLT
jgi:DNA-binding CsgD family transcriptional regulator